MYNIVFASVSKFIENRLYMVVNSFQLCERGTASCRLHGTVDMVPRGAPKPALGRAARGPPELREDARRAQRARSGQASDGNGCLIGAPSRALIDCKIWGGGVVLTASALKL